MAARANQAAPNLANRLELAQNKRDTVLNPGGGYDGRIAADIAGGELEKINEKNLADIKKQMEVVRDGAKETINAVAQALKKDIPLELMVRLDQQVTLKGNVMAQDGTVTASEVEGLDDYIMEAMNRYYNERQKENDDKVAKENGRAPTPPSSTKK